jgi:uncharacterized metal-binding protein
VNHVRGGEEERIENDRKMSLKIFHRCYSHDNEPRFVVRHLRPETNTFFQVVHVCCKVRSFTSCDVSIHKNELELIVTF